MPNLQIFAADGTDSPARAYALGLLPRSRRRQSIQLQETNPAEENAIAPAHASGLGGGGEGKRNKELSQLLRKGSRAAYREGGKSFRGRVLLPWEPLCSQRISSPLTTQHIIAAIRSQTRPLANPWKMVGLSFSTERVHFFGILDVKHS